MRIAARKGLLAGKFRHGSVFVDEGSWTHVDPNDKEVRATLLAYVPSHIRVAENQGRELAEAGLEMKDGKLIDLRKLAAAENRAPSGQKAARAEK